ncbi:MAG: signal peptidase I [Nanoarchaeota archaeon]|nr:signal peptidase I [Nanoarchaeota archaeon]
MSFWKKMWQFIWHDDSIWSWIVNVIIAFILVKFIIYPGIGLLLGTHYPIVAVVSGSMEHNQAYEQWWEANKDYYEQYNITKEEFNNYRFPNGFNKGDIMILTGKEPKAIKVGDVVVYQTTNTNPIIHRVIAITENNKQYTYTTKGDHNNVHDPKPVEQEQIQNTGIAIIRIPYIGWLKIMVTNLFGGQA